MSVSQFANDNNVYFEFHPKYCLSKDILSDNILLQGEACKGLYKFNLVDSRKSRCGRNYCKFSEISQKNANNSNFDI